MKSSVPITSVLASAPGNAKKNDLEELRERVRKAMEDDRRLLDWLQAIDGGRGYLWGVLLRIVSLDPNFPGARAAVHAPLADQLKLILKCLGEAINNKSLSRLSGRLLYEIQRTGAGDNQAPAKLRLWLQFRDKHQARQSGEQIAKKHWPRSEPLRRAFSYVANHLCLVDELTRCLGHRHRPRELARALVNHVGGRDRDLARASEEVKASVAQIAKNEHFLAAANEMHRLLAAATPGKTPRNQPARQLCKALEIQFRSWRRERFATHKHTTTVALGMAEPWRIHEYETRKKLAVAVDKLSPKPSGKERPFATSQRYTRKCD